MWLMYMQQAWYIFGIRIKVASTSAIMFERVSKLASQSSGFPSLKVNAGTPYGASANVPEGNLSVHGGRILGGSTLSEPNTSPDVITIIAELYSECRVAGGKGSTTPGDPIGLDDKDLSAVTDWQVKSTKPVASRTRIPGGTPVVVYHDAKNHGPNDPVHKVSVLNEDFEARWQADASLNEAEAHILFLTVTVGDSYFEPKRPTHLAIAVQNVATVNFEGTDFAKHDLLKMAVGDRFYLKARIGYEDDDKLGVIVPFYELDDRKTNPDQYPFARYTKFIRATNNVFRVLTLVAPPVGNTALCDLGRFIVHS